MFFLHYFVGLIFIALFSFLLIFFFDKIKLEEKISNFDEKNSGPVYDFIKSIFLIFSFIIIIFSIGALVVLPIEIWKAFETGNILMGIILSLIGSLFIIFDGNFLDK